MKIAVIGTGSMGKNHVRVLKNCFVKDDLMNGISGRSNSKDVLNANEYADKVREKTFGIIGYDREKFKNI